VGFLPDPFEPSRYWPFLPFGWLGRERKEAQMVERDNVFLL
jgi:hypothetical protein